MTEHLAEMRRPLDGITHVLGSTAAAAPMVLRFLIVSLCGIKVAPQNKHIWFSWFPQSVKAKSWDSVSN